MPLHVAIQMDPIEKLDIMGDTSFALGLEAQTRGHHLWYYTPDQLSYEEGQISCLLYTSPSPRDKRQSRMPSSA